MMQQRLATLIVSPSIKAQLDTMSLGDIFHIGTFEKGVIVTDDCPFRSEWNHLCKPDLNAEFIDGLHAKRLIFAINDDSSAKRVQDLISYRYYGDIVDDTYQSNVVYFSESALMEYIRETTFGLSLLKDSDSDEIFRFGSQIFNIDQALNLVKQLDLPVRQYAPQELINALKLTSVDETFTEVKDEPLLLAESHRGLLMIDGHHRLYQWQERESVPVVTVPRQYLHLFHETLKARAI